MAFIICRVRTESIGLSFQTGTLKESLSSKVKIVRGLPLSSSLKVSLSWYFSWETGVCSYCYIIYCFMSFFCEGMIILGFILIRSEFIRRFWVVLFVSKDFTYVLESETNLTWFLLHKLIDGLPWVVAGRFYLLKSSKLLESLWIISTFYTGRYEEGLSRSLLLLL
jgi:hypothetical protein